ncbi:hypothetical protein LzC2_41820 [Planctomycetes bacterium LzC2]|uniref:Uncharacterized protein n=1 Tax=Alienimonas chondri TaxID=2681879 RepID=A0ABX1VLA5_9PLAN|nr:hypothetical protein [Alienimonas chondri]
MILQQFAGLEEDVFDRHFVGRPRPEHGEFRIGHPALSVQQAIEFAELAHAAGGGRFGARSLDGRPSQPEAVLQRVQQLQRRGVPVQAGLQALIGPVFLRDGVGQIVHDLPFLLAEQRPFPGDLQFGVLNRGVSAAEAQRHAELHPDFPLLEVAAGERLERFAAGNLRSRRTVRGADEPIAEPADPIAGDRVELRGEEVLGRFQFHLRPTDAQPLRPQFRPYVEGASGDRAPIEDDLRRNGRAVVERAQDAVVVQRHAHQQPQPAIRRLHPAAAAERAAAASGAGEGVFDRPPGERFFHLFLEPEVLLADQRLFLRVRPAQAFGTIPERFRDHHRPIAGLPFGVEVAIGVRQFPIGVRHVADEVPQAGFELGLADLVIHPSDDDAVIEPWLAVRSGEAVERHAAAPQQGLTGFSLDVILVGAAEQVRGGVVLVVFRELPQGEGAAGRGAFAQFGLRREQILLELLHAAAGELVINDAVVVLRQQRRGELRIERGQRRLRAESGVRILQRGVEPGADAIRVSQHRGAQIAGHRAVLDREGDRLLQGDLPMFDRGVGVANRSRFKTERAAGIVFRGRGRDHVRDAGSLRNLLERDVAVRPPQPESVDRRATDARRR